MPWFYVVQLQKQFYPEKFWISSAYHDTDIYLVLCKGIALRKIEEEIQFFTNTETEPLSFLCLESSTKQ